VEPLRLISDALGRWTKRQWVRFACMALGCSLVVAAVFTVSMPSIRGMFVVTNENWRDLCAFVARHKSDGDVVVLQRAYAQYMLGYYGKHLPPVHALEDGEIEKLDAICAQAKSVWYIGIWGCPSPGTAEKMKKLGFITLFDHTAQGIRLDLRLQSATPAKRLDAQIEWRKKASDEMWPHPWMDVWLARAYREKGNAARATQLLEKARTAYLRLCETDTWLLTNGSFRVIEMKDYGDLLKEMGRLDEARVVYYNILDLWPEKSFVYFALYNLERDAGNRMQAAECLLHYAALEPNHPVWIGDSLARMYLEADNVELAVNAYRDTYALALKRGDAGARYWWMLAGDTLAERNQPEEAIRELFALLQAHPDYALARAHLGRLLIKAKRNEEAAKVVHEGLQLTPDDELLKNLDKTLKGK
jgi:tetratricopeptide (TPR) repeat protein